MIALLEALGAYQQFLAQNGRILVSIYSARECELMNKFME